MGKCVGKPTRIEHLDQTKKSTETYDKFGNLIAGAANRIEIQFNGRVLMFSNSIQVSFVLSDLAFTYSKFGIESDE